MHRWAAPVEVIYRSEGEAITALLSQGGNDVDDDAFLKQLEGPAKKGEKAAVNRAMAHRPRRQRLPCVEPSRHRPLHVHIATACKARL